MKKTIPFTKEGYQAILAEFNKLQADRPATVIELRRASDLGDRSENAAYKVARQKLSRIDRRLAQLTQIQRYAIITEPKTTDTIEIGSQVTITNGTDTMQFVIVGGYESDIPAGRLSVMSPIGKALLGKKKHNSVQVQIPNGLVTYTVIDIKN